VGNGVSLFQMSSTISHFPLSCIQCTMYLPESTAAIPGGNFAPAGKAQCQRPVPGHAARAVDRFGAQRQRRPSTVFIVAKNARMASLPLTVAMFGGMMIVGRELGSESAWPVLRAGHCVGGVDRLLCLRRGIGRRAIGRPAGE
jgi:hypothetical protein